MDMLSVIIPVYNEENTIGKIIDDVKNVNLGNVKKEIIVVDDASTDRTNDILKNIKGIKLIRHSKNRGKGTAIRIALRHVTGTIVLIQDADFEYDTKDYPDLIKPIIEKKSKVVYGSRVLGRKKVKYIKFAYYVAGKSLTMLTNFLYGTEISDEPCGYKVFDSKTIKGISLKCRRFEFCPEVTAKLAKKRIKIHEAPISYNPRSRKEGKKIKFRDWLEAVYTLIKYRFVD